MPGLPPVSCKDPGMQNFPAVSCRDPDMQSFPAACYTDPDMQSFPAACYTDPAPDGFRSGSLKALLPVRFGFCLSWVLKKNPVDPGDVCQTDPQIDRFLLRE